MLGSMPATQAQAGSVWTALGLDQRNTIVKETLKLYSRELLSYVLVKDA
jgi:hypothetical protein